MKNTLLYFETSELSGGEVAINPAHVIAVLPLVNLRAKVLLSDGSSLTTSHDFREVVEALKQN